MGEMWYPMELIMDARCSNKHILTSEALLSEWIRSLCNLIGMTPVGPVYMESFPFPGSTEKAISACQFLGESGIIVHPYPEFDFIYINVFSCRDFDALKAVRFIKNTLKITESTTYLFQRGINMETRAPVKLIPTLPFEEGKERMTTGLRRSG